MTLLEPIIDAIKMKKDTPFENYPKHTSKKILKLTYWKTVRPRIDQLEKNHG